MCIRDRFQLLPKNLKRLHRNSLIRLCEAEHHDHSLAARNFNRLFYGRRAAHAFDHCVDPGKSCFLQRCFHILMNRINTNIRPQALSHLPFSFHRFQQGHSGRAGQPRPVSYTQLVQLILIHLLKFGAVNQKFGYQNGNRFLKKVARSLENYFPTGQVFHVGNVEFAILHEFKSEEDALARTESARLLFSEPWTVGSFSSSLPAAITDIICKEESFSSGDVMERLQFGMDCAKKNNPSYLIHFDSSWNQLWERRNLLFQYMKKNIAENNFEVFYQPVFCCNTGRFCSAEALVRMRDPEGNLISPGEFIPLAEQAGLIGDITLSLIHI